jgi:response regulator NasT
MLKILVIDESCSRAAEICSGLALAGHHVAAVLPSAVDLSGKIEELRPDVILIGTDSPSRDTLENLAVMNAAMPRPVIIFAQESDHETIRAAVRAGVSAYIVDGLDPARLKPVIDVAIASFDEHQSVRAELAAATKKLSERKLIERAKGLLMKSRGIDEAEAHAMLRKLAMERAKPMAVVARDVIELAKYLL